MTSPLVRFVLRYRAVGGPAPLLLLSGPRDRACVESARLVIRAPLAHFERIQADHFSGALATEFLLSHRGYLPKGAKIVTYPPRIIG
jgi:hypothetical protein